MGERLPTLISDGEWATRFVDLFVQRSRCATAVPSTAEIYQENPFIYGSHPDTDVLLRQIQCGVSRR